MITEHHTAIQVRADDDYVDFIINDEAQGHTILSLTPKEARQLSDKLLHASQRVEDQTPHGNS